MGDANPNAVYPQVEINFQGVFVRHPFSYEGTKFLFTDMDFAGMTYDECVTFLERFMQEDVKKLYYCEPYTELRLGLRPIANDCDYAGFIFDAYGTDGNISVYVDHFGDGLDEWFDEVVDEEEHNSCVEGVEDDKKTGQKEGDVVNSVKEAKRTGTNVDKQNDTNKVVQPMNRTSQDAFLSKLCPEEEEDKNDEKLNADHIQDESGPIKQVHAIFNEDLHWKK